MSMKITGLTATLVPQMCGTHPCAIPSLSHTHTVQLQQEQSSDTLLFLILGKELSHSCFLWITLDTTF